jgi:hypothetical protein
MHPAASEELFISEVEKLTGNPRLLEINGWVVKSTTYPYLKLEMLHRKSGKVVAFQFECTDWDEQPPSLTVDGAWPNGGNGHWHQSGSPLGGGGFCCMAGIREYHRHSSHITDRWENYRGKPGFSLVEIILKVSGALQHANV